MSLLTDAWLLTVPDCFALYLVPAAVVQLSLVPPSNTNSEHLETHIIETEAVSHRLRKI